jgi:tetratricopeptide (TPR) repeat protein
VTTSSFLKLSGNIRIGELLVQAGMLTQSQLQEATRHAGTKRLQIGQILVMYGYLTARDLQSALAAQSMIRDRSLELSQALRSLKVAYKTGSRFEDVVSSQTSGSNQKLPTGKLGELLLDSGAITSEQFFKAMDKSMTTGVPLGRTLVFEKLISDELLSAVLDAQVRLRDQMLTREEAIQAVQRAAGLPLTGAASSGQQQLNPPVGRLGELLVMANVLSATTVLDSLEWALANQQSIGQVFQSQGLISQELLDNALTLQRMIRENALTLPQAAEALKAIHQEGADAQEVIEGLKAQAVASKPTIDYMKLLTLARVVSHDDIGNAIEAGLNKPEVLGRLLVLTGFITKDAMMATLSCLSLLISGELTQDDAVVSLDYCLHHRPNRPIDFEDALKDLGWQPQRKESKSLESGGEVAAAKPVPPADAVAKSAANESAANAEANATVNDDVASAPADDVVTSVAASEAVTQAASSDAVTNASPALAADAAAPDEVARPQAADASAQAPHTPTDAADVAASVAADPIANVAADPIANVATAIAAEAAEATAIAAEAATVKSLAETKGLEAPPPEVENVPQGIAKEKLSEVMEPGVDIDTSELEDEGDSQAVTADLSASAPGSVKGRKFAETIAPEDPRARELANFINPQSKNDGILEKTAKGQLNSVVFESYARLAESYIENGNNADAQHVYERILVLRLQELGPNNISLVGDFKNLAAVLCTQEKFDRAEPFLRRAIYILESAGSQPLTLADFVSFLANIYLRQGKFGEAEPLLNQALDVRRKELGPDHLEISDSLFDLARLYRKTNRTEESEQLYTRAKDILAKNQTHDQFAD